MALTVGRGLADGFHLHRRKAKAGLQAAGTGPDEFDRGGLVPDVVFRSQQLHEHQHVKRVGHGVQAAAKVDAARIAVKPAQPQADIDFVPVRRDALDADAGAGKRRPQVHDEPGHPRSHFHESKRSFENRHYPESRSGVNRPLAALAYALEQANGSSSSHVQRFGHARHGDDDPVRGTVEYGGTDTRALVTKHECHVTGQVQ